MRHGSCFAHCFAHCCYILFIFFLLTMPLITRIVLCEFYVVSFIPFSAKDFYVKYTYFQVLYTVLKILWQYRFLLTVLMNRILSLTVSLFF